MNDQIHEGKVILHRATCAQSEDQQQSSLELLTQAIHQVSEAKVRLDQVLREQFPQGLSVVFVKGATRESGTVISHGHDGTLTVRLTANPSRTKRVSAHEIRA